MKLTKEAITQLLQCMRLLTCGEHLQVNELGRNAYERLQCGNLSETMLAVQQLPPAEFVPELEHKLEGLAIAISFPNKQRMLISVQEQYIESSEKRRQTIIRTDNQRRLNIEILTSDVFPNWLVGLCDMEHDQIKSPEQMQLLHLCCCLFNSSKVFAQFQSLTLDSLTKLQSRSALQSSIDENINQSAMNLCMIHCRDFQIVNQKFGLAKGDQVLNEIATIIDNQTRVGDLACRFGGALFGIVSNGNNVDEGLKLAHKLQIELHNRPFLKNAIRLSFNVGVAHIKKEDCNDANTSASTILVNRAEQALKAAQNSYKQNIEHWEADKFKHDEQDFNYIGGIFSPDNITNYRNMLLLSDISTITADEYEFSRLLGNVVEHQANSQTHFATSSHSPEALQLAVARSVEADNLIRHKTSFSQPPKITSSIQVSIDKETWLQDYDQSISTFISELNATHEYYQSEPGVWIELSLFKFAYQHCRTNKLIAARLQIPISTARRKVNKARSFTLPTCPESWQPVSVLLDKLAQGAVSIANPLDTLKLHLLATILKQNPHNMTHAAQLLGVSEPTLYKLKRSL